MAWTKCQVFIWNIYIQGSSFFKKFLVIAWSSEDDQKMTGIYNQNMFFFKKVYSIFITKVLPAFTKNSIRNLNYFLDSLVTSEMFLIFFKKILFVFESFCINLNCIYPFTGYLSEYVCVMSFPEILIKPL